MLTAITTNKTASSLKIQRTVSASVERVYKAWTDPEQMRRWFGCQYVTGIKVVQNLSVGGQYQVQMTTDPDGVVITVHGVYQEVIPNAKLVYTWNSDSVEYPAADTMICVQFIARGQGTEIVLEHTNFALEKSVEGHSLGWTASFNKITEFVQAAI
ncbi:SRPBCC domain-containing protein [soil metagenome]